MKNLKQNKSNLPKVKIKLIKKEEFEKVANMVAEDINNIHPNPNKKHIADAKKMVSGLNYDAYLKRLIWISEKIKNSEGEIRDSWLTNLSGYLDALKEMYEK